jgi:hypothetical protein
MRPYTLPCVVSVKKQSLSLNEHRGLEYPTESYRLGAQARIPAKGPVLSGYGVHQVTAYILNIAQVCCLSTTFFP